MLLTRRLIIGFFLGLFWWMTWSASARVGITADESAHITSGYLYWTKGDYRFQPENGNLPQRIAGLPLLFQKLTKPSAEKSSYANGDIWGVARDFFFESGNDVVAMLSSSRGAIAWFGLALNLLIYTWSQRLFGTPGGLLSLGLSIFCPHLLAHSGLATSDIAATTTFLFAIFTGWQLLQRITIPRIIAAGGAAGLLAVSKYSAVLFAPMVLAMTVVSWLGQPTLPVAVLRDAREVRGVRRGLWLGGAALVATLLALVAIWTFYGFRYSAAPENQPPKFAMTWEKALITTPETTGSLMADNLPRKNPIDLRAGFPQHVIAFCRDHRLLPEAYLYGLAFTLRHAQGRLAYFAGEYGERGWLGFFPTAFLFKSTLPMLLILSCAIARIGALRTPRGLLYQLSPLVIALVVYGTFALTSHLNIGHRHILLVYPIVYILCGAVLFNPNQTWPGWFSALMVFCALWQAATSWAVRPHYLTYFNALAGGPTGGHRYFVDSSLDWGQGLPDLQAWLKTRPSDRTVFLSYFGSDEPRRFGISARRIGDVYFNPNARPILTELTAGTYVISATMLHRVYTEVRGAWSEAYEANYRQLTMWLAENPQPSALRSTNLATVEQLQFGRLCHYLEKRTPDAIVANVFFVYELSREEVALALYAPLRP